MRSWLFSLVLSLSAPAYAAETEYFGVFAHTSAEPTLAVLIGPIEPATPLDFRRLLRKHPEVTTLALHSGGGDVTAALLVAQEVSFLGFTTIISEGSECYSACSFIFFAGEARQVNGRLGVHQISGEVSNDYSTQLAIADILESMADFGVPNAIITDMLRTAPDSIKIYDAAAAEALGLNRNASEIEVAVIPPIEASEMPTAPRPSGAIDRYYALEKAQSVVELLSQNDFGDALLDEAASILVGHLGIDFLPAHTRAHFLIGPIDADGTTYIPYRASFYVPQAEPPGYRHLATVALTDRGEIVQGVDPWSNDTQPGGDNKSRASEWSPYSKWPIQ